MRILLVALLFCARPAPASAASEDGGTAGSFLTLGVGVRGLGMGGAQVASSEDAGAVLWNPANLVRLSRGEALGGSVLLPAASNYLFLAGAYPTIRYGTVGVAFARLASARIEGRGVNNARESGSDFSATHTAILAGYGAELPVGSLGVTVLALSQSLLSARQSAVTASVGGTLDASAFAASLRGLTLGLRLADLVPASLGSAAVPPSVRPGVEYRALAGALVLAVDADVTVARALRYAVGAEYTYRRLVSARLGYNGAPAAGVGLRLGPVRGDYAVAFLPSPLGISHRAGVAVPFGPDLSLPRIQVQEPVLSSAGDVSVATLKPNLSMVIESRSPLETVKIAGRAMRLAERNRFTLKQAVGLREGRNTILVEAENRARRRTQLRIEIVADTQPPAIEILEPKGRTRTSKDEIVVKAVLTDASEIRAVLLNDLPVIISPATRIEINQPVSLRWGGRNTIRIAATDALGHTRPREFEVDREGGPPAPASSEAIQAAISEQTARQSLLKGKELVAARRWEAAVLELRYALRLVPTLGEAQQLLDQAEKEVARLPSTSGPSGGTIDSAQVAGMSEDLRRALEARLARGKQYYDLGQYRRAKVEFELVLELNKQYKAAVEMLEKAKDKLAQYVHAKVAEAKSARQKGRLASEIASLRDALSEDESNAEAQRLLRDARDRVPTVKREMHLKALNLYAENKLEEAIRTWKETLELDPEDEQIKKALDRAQQKLIEMKSGTLGK